MQTTKIGLFNAILILLISIFLISCSLQRKIALNYIKSTEKKSILLYFPDYISKTNLKTDSIPNVEHLDPIIIDSIGYFESSVIQFVNDSLFLSICKNSFIHELNLLGIEVYEPDRIEEFEYLQDSSFIFNLAQMQLEEYFYVENAEYPVDDINSYYVDLKTNAISVNSWFELYRNKVADERYPVLYSSYFINDEVKGRFIKKWVDNEKKYFYRIDTVISLNVNELATDAGKRYAINLSDYLLNLYIQEKMPAGKIPEYYFHYSYKGQKLITWYEDNFIEMDPK